MDNKDLSIITDKILILTREIEQMRIIGDSSNSTVNKINKLKELFSSISFETKEQYLKFNSDVYLYNEKTNYLRTIMVCESIKTDEANLRVSSGKRILQYSTPYLTIDLNNWESKISQFYIYQTLK